MAGENGINRTNENNRLHNILEQTPLFKIPRPEDFDKIPNLDYFKKIAEEAYNDLVEKEPLYLLNEGDKIGSFEIQEQFQNQGEQGTLFTAKAWRDSPLFKTGEICLIKGIKSPPPLVSKEEHSTIMEHYAKIYRSFYNERRILHCLRKKYQPLEENHLVQMLECNLDPSGGKPYMALKYIPKKEIKPMPPYKGISPRQTIVVIHDISHALKKLAEEKIIHGDIKKENLIIDLEGRATLIDLGCGLYLESDPEHAHIPHTASYIPPEYAIFLLQDKEMLKADQIKTVLKTAKYDTYSLGATIYELLTGEKPVACTNAAAETSADPASLIVNVYQQIANRTKSFNIDELVKSNFIASDDREILQQINIWLKQMTEPNPSKRIDIHTTYHEIRTFIINNTELKKLIIREEPKEETTEKEMKIQRFTTRRIASIQTENSAETTENKQADETENSEKIIKNETKKIEYQPDEKAEELKNKIKKSYF